jgi:hypothetical protein
MSIFLIWHHLVCVLVLSCHGFNVHFSSTNNVELFPCLLSIHNIFFSKLSAQIFCWFFSFFGGTGDWTQGLHLELLHQPYFYESFFEIRSCRTICPVWRQTSILLISASWVARIIGVSHGAQLPIFIRLFVKIELWVLCSKYKCFSRYMVCWLEIIEQCEILMIAISFLFLIFTWCCLLLGNIFYFDIMPQLLQQVL